MKTPLILIETQPTARRKTTQQPTAVSHHKAIGRTPRRRRTAVHTSPEAMRSCKAVELPARDAFVMRGCHANPDDAEDHQNWRNREPELHVHAESPNDLRLSGERSGAERVR